jgi:PRTRC genetic system protein A
MNMNIPIVQAGNPLPASGPAYIVGKGGFYLRKETALYQVIVSVPEVPAYAEVKEELKWLAPPVPYELIESAHQFFRAVYWKYGGEAILALILNKDNSWQLDVPEQSVSPAHLDYDLTSIAGKGRLAGTIHSHCNMGAFFSTTDDNDTAQGCDGLHIVLGRIMLPVPEIAAAVCINGSVFKLLPREVISNLPEDGIMSGVPDSWLDKVQAAKVKPPAIGMRRNYQEITEIEEDLPWMQW